VEFERILARGKTRLHEVVAEIRILLSQTRDQLRRIMIERASERVVTRFLSRRRGEVSATFPEGFEGLMAAMYGDVATGLVEASRSLLESAYFVEADQTLREAARCGSKTHAEVQPLQLYAEGMQSFLDGDYHASLSSLEDWLDSGGADQEHEYARFAATALSRIERLVTLDAAGEAIAVQAKQLQLRLETAFG